MNRRREKYQRNQVQKEQAKVDSWNAKHPPGTPVIVHKDFGDVVETITRSVAEVLGGHTAVIWLEGISGCYDLDRVEARESSV